MSGNINGKATNSTHLNFEKLGWVCQLVEVRPNRICRERIKMWYRICRELIKTLVSAFCAQQ